MFSVLLGVAIFGERLRWRQWLPIGLAALGVIYLALGSGSLPWIALLLAGTFGLYGVVKKTAPLGPLIGLTIETGLLFLPAVAYLLYCELNGRAAFLHSTPRENWMMIGGGLITAVPLLLFAAAASASRSSAWGSCSMFTPTIQFLLGVLVYREAFTLVRLIGFGLVWAGLAIFWFEDSTPAYRAVEIPMPELGEG